MTITESGRACRGNSIYVLIRTHAEKRVASREKATPDGERNRGKAEGVCSLFGREKERERERKRRET